MWTIAGFDPSNGAGITADLMTFAAHGLFGCSAITALTVQSTLSVAATAPVSPELLAQTLTHLAADLPPAGIKIGMLGSPEALRVVARFLRDELPRKQGLLIPVILDPVLRSSSGRELFPSSALPEFRRELLPQVDYITPNWGELAGLTGEIVLGEADAERAALALIAMYPSLSVVITGGDQETPTDTLVSPKGKISRFRGEHIATSSTHGTGCAFSSALLANLVRGMGAEQAVAAAKSFVRGALLGAPGLGHGKSPMGLLWTRPLTS